MEGGSWRKPPNLQTIVKSKVGETGTTHSQLLLACQQLRYLTPNSTASTSSQQSQPMLTTPTVVRRSPVAAVDGCHLAAITPAAAERSSLMRETFRGTVGAVKRHLEANAEEPPLKCSRSEQGSTALAPMMRDVGTNCCSAQVAFREASRLIVKEMRPELRFETLFPPLEQIFEEVNAHLFTNGDPLIPVDGIRPVTPSAKVSTGETVQDQLRKELLKTGDIPTPLPHLDPFKFMRAILRDYRPC